MNFDELIQKEEKALLRDLRELVRIPSVSVPGTGRAPYGAECRRALDWFLSRASEMGFQTRDVDGHCGWCEYGEGRRPVRTGARRGGTLHTQGKQADGRPRRP